MPSASPIMPKLNRRAPVFTSVPTRPRSKPSTTIAIALMSDPRARTTAATKPHTISEKYSAGPNCKATAASGGDAERRSGVALTRHLVTVDGGHDRGCLARNVDQDGGGRAAVLGAVIDAREQDQRRLRLQGERDRQQHGHRRHRTDPGQHADDGAEQNADEAVSDVRDGQRNGKSQTEI